MAISKATSGASITEGKLQWEITQWSALDSTPDEATRSPILKCAGHDWQMEVFPGGDPAAAPEEKKEDAKNAVALFLRYNGTSKKLRTAFTLTIKN